MRHILYFFILSGILISSSADAQRWKRYRHEAWGGIGGTNFLGELGGSASEARDLFFDFDVKSSRYVITGGYRYKLNEVVSLRGGLAYARLSGSDAYSGDIHRFSRNLSFRTPLVELSAMGELYFIREKTSNRYKVRGIRGALGSGMSAYVAGGIGSFWFNPRGLAEDGKWYSLQPMGTEGQGLPGQPKKYSRINFCIPMAIGAKYSVNRNVAISLEYGFRLTFTDYLDDVSTNYYDPFAIAAANGGLGTPKGDAAFYLSNPAIEVTKENGDVFIAGGKKESGAPWGASSGNAQQRGDRTTNDTYMFAVLALNYKFTSKKTNRPKF